MTNAQTQMSNECRTAGIPKAISSRPIGRRYIRTKHFIAILQIKAEKLLARTNGGQQTSMDPADLAGDD